MKLHAETRVRSASACQPPTEQQFLKRSKAESHTDKQRLQEEELKMMEQDERGSTDSPLVDERFLLINE